MSYLNLLIVSSNAAEQKLEILLDNKQISLYASRVNLTYKYYNLYFENSYEIIGNNPFLIIVDLFITEKRYYNYLTKNKMSSSKVLNNLTFEEFSTSKNYESVLLTFPGFYDATYNFTYNSYKFKGIQENFKDTKIISFYDNYLSTGSYMTVDEAGNDIFNELVNFTKKYEEKNLIFYGASKGGYIALKLAQYFPKAKVIVSVPQTNLEFFFSKRPGISELMLPFFEEHVQLENEYIEIDKLQNEVTWLIGKDDRPSNYDNLEKFKNVQPKNITAIVTGVKHGLVAEVYKNVIFFYLLKFSNSLLQSSQFTFNWSITYFEYKNKILKLKSSIKSLNLNYKEVVVFLQGYNKEKLECHLHLSLGWDKYSETIDFVGTRHYEYQDFSDFIYSDLEYFKLVIYTKNQVYTSTNNVFI